MVNKMKLSIELENLKKQKILNKSFSKQISVYKNFKKKLNDSGIKPQKDTYDVELMDKVYHKI